MGQTTIAAWLRKPHDPVTPTSSRPAAEAKPDSTPALAQSMSENVDLSRRDVEEAGDTDSCLPLSHATQETPKQAGVASNVALKPCTETHLKSFRRLLSLLLPIPYPDSFYRQTVADPVIASLTRIALWSEASRWSLAAADGTGLKQQTQLVAAIRCRLIDDQHNIEKHTPVLYISALATLSALRERGLASMLLRAVTATAVMEYGARAVMAHVWDQNNEALAWYKSRGFKVVGKEEQYYRRLAPHTAAWVIRREVQPSDLLPPANDTC